MVFVEMRKQFILDSEDATQCPLLRQEDRIPDERKTTLAGVKVKMKETPCNLVTTNKIYRADTEVLAEELLNESAF